MADRRSWPTRGGTVKRSHTILTICCPLLVACRAFGRSTEDCAAPVWGTGLCDTCYRCIRWTQGKALRTSAGYHWMSSVHHLHAEASVLSVGEHSELLSARCLNTGCLGPEGVNISVTAGDPPGRLMGRHCSLDIAVLWSRG